MLELKDIKQDVLRKEITRIFHQEVIALAPILRYTAFNVKLADGTCFVARCEHSIASDARLRQMTERVQITNYVRSSAGVPIPRVVHTDTSDAAGSPWVLMDRCAGETLGDAFRSWRHLPESIREPRVIRATKAVGSALARIFELSVPATLSAAFQESYQHFHTNPMPASFDIKLVYDDLTDPGFDIMKARALRQETATYIAHVFWSGMHDHEYSAERRGQQEELCTLSRLKALVPSMIPGVDEYIADGGLLGMRKINHFDPSITNLMISPEDGTLTGIIDWEWTRAAPAVLAAAYPEWVRYDGIEETPLFWWSTCMVDSVFVSSSADRRDYSHYREAYEQAVADVSPSYVKAMRAGRKIREIFDWTQKLAYGGNKKAARLAFVNRWIEDKAAEFDVALPAVFHTKSSMPSTPQ